MYDVIIIGAGPAGLTAAIYTSRKKLSTLVLSTDVGGQAILSSAVENYLGYNYITGADLVQKFEEHVREFDIALKVGVAVKSLKKIEGGFEVSTEDQSYQSKTVIIASGKIPRKLNVPGEKEFLGRGVTYCATCDAPIFKGMDVAVIGGGNSALDATLQLTKIANRIYLIDINPKMGGDEVMLEKAEASPNVTTLNNTETLKIKGDTTVKQIKVKNRSTGEEKYLDVRGLFIEIGSIPSCDFVGDLVKRNQFGEIEIDKRNSTNVLGIFAAGDATDVIEKQIIIAAGEGSKAALAAYDYLARLKK